MSDIEQFKPTRKTSFLVNPTLYKALRVKLLASDDDGNVSRWLREKMYEEVIEDEEIEDQPEEDSEPSAADVFGDMEENENGES